MIILIIDPQNNALVKVNSDGKGDDTSLHQKRGIIAHIDYASFLQVKKENKEVIDVI